MVIRTRHVGLAADVITADVITADVITAFKLLSWCWPGQEHVDLYEDLVMFGGGPRCSATAHQALYLTALVFQDMKKGN